MFTTGEGLIIQEDAVTKDGLQSVFATNLFGHYLLVSGIYITYYHSNYHPIQYS